MRKDEITLVTAFFDIGRGDLDNESLRRTTGRYMDDFSRWARLKNKLIVYTESKFAKEILEIRARHGLSEKTEVVSLDHVFEVEPAMFQRMCQVEQKGSFRAFRYYENAYSNTAKYDYVMLMKYWVLQDACKHDNAKGNGVAWIDFGYDHGGVSYPNPEEFSFLWDYPFSDKIQLFCLNDPNQISGADSLQLSYDCMIGGLIYVPMDLAGKFWVLMRDNMQALLSLDCIDDDQQLLLMAYKRQPDWFEIHLSDWFLPLKECGGGHLTVRESGMGERKKNPARKMADRILKAVGVRVSNQKDFARRSYRRAKKYYPE